MKRPLTLALLCAFSFTFAVRAEDDARDPSAQKSAPAPQAGAPRETVPDITKEPSGRPITVDKTETTEGEEKDWAMESITRSQHIYPSNWGTAGLFRIRSAESLPDGALTFGVGAEFYAVSDIPPSIAAAYNSSNAHTIAEALFVGYAPTKNLTLAVRRRNSSTTFGNPQTLISSLGDINFTGMYSFPVSPSFAVAPFVDVLLASNFNELNSNGDTVSLGLGLAGTYSLFPSTGAPFMLHANVVYHVPQIRTTGPLAIAPETFFDFSRFHTVTLRLGAEYKASDSVIPFLELSETVHASSGLSFGRQPSKLTFGARFMPLENKSLAVLLGGEAGLGRGVVPGVPYSPPFQAIGQLSYTVGVTQTERKHYFTTKDVNVVDRKFVIKKSIDFKVASAELNPSSNALLNQIAEVIKQNKIKRLLIAGHTDSTATEDYNLRLSQNRAESVKRYLVGQGIPEETLTAQGYGKRKPRASNATEVGRAQNRRVEFFILE